MAKLFAGYGPWDREIKTRVTHMTNVITLVIDDRENQQLLEMTALEARELANRLNENADFVDPEEHQIPKEQLPDATEQDTPANSNGIYLPLSAARDCMESTGNHPNSASSDPTPDTCTNTNARAK